VLDSTFGNGRRFGPARHHAAPNSASRNGTRFIFAVQHTKKLQLRQECMAIKLSKEVEDRLLASLQRYCADNLDEEVGQLKARLLLDFCLREIGPSVYNQAVQDAQAALQEKIAELDAYCYETEFAYWKK
jgi:uncharacterized protein (DUF2164 family)